MVNPAELTLPKALTLLASDTTRPLNAALRARLHLRRNARYTIAFLRGFMHLTDAISRVLFRNPFFALRESEALLEDVKGKTGLALIQELLARKGGTRITDHGLDNVPLSGPVIIASTHPTGMFDFLVHAAALLERRPDLRVVANRETEIFLGSDLIVAVEIDKNNRAIDAGKTQQSMQAHLDAGGALLIFGSGRVPYRSGDTLIEPAWRRGATIISKRCQAPIIPAAIDARNSRYYYNLRKYARYFSGRDDNFGAMIGSLRYAAELLEKLGGAYDVHYGLALAPGTSPDTLKIKAETLVPHQYAQAPK